MKSSNEDKKLELTENELNHLKQATKKLVQEYNDTTTPVQDAFIAIYELQSEYETASEEEKITITEKIASFEQQKSSILNDSGLKDLEKMIDKNTETIKKANLDLYHDSLENRPYQEFTGTQFTKD